MQIVLQTTLGGLAPGELYDLVLTSFIKQIKLFIHLLVSPTNHYMFDISIITKLFL